jgi:hypothetical protein
MPTQPTQTWSVVSELPILLRGIARTLGAGYDSRVQEMPDQSQALHVPHPVGGVIKKEDEENRIVVPLERVLCKVDDGVWRKYRAGYCREVDLFVFADLGVYIP